ncbi:MAG TPA: hypothetical protein EYG57_03455 [Planctomycetes bacterium]|nr:hypothetical protein [Planctomycetaceae bacterium]HIM28597.1 hypothetical protein [Planctomycetota bacterium]
MANKKNRGKARGKHGRRSEGKRGQHNSGGPVRSSSEKKAAEALTVGLVLAALATLFTEVLVVGIRVGMLVVPEWQSSESLQASASLMLIVAAITGAVCLVLTPIVSRTRKVRLPLSVIVGIAIAAIAPYLTIIASKWH